MTKTNKTKLLVMLGLLFIFALFFATANSAAFAETDEPTGYYFKVDGKIVENNTIMLKRGATSGYITFWHDGVEQSPQWVIVPQTIAAKYLTFNYNRVTASANMPISYTSEDRPFLMCIYGGGYEYLYFQILPDDTLSVYNTGSGPFTFTVEGITDIQTIDDISEKASVSFSVSCAGGASIERSSSVSNSKYQVLQINASTLSGYYLSGNLPVEVISLTYSYGTQSITYDVATYGDLLFKQTSTYMYTYFGGGNGTTSDPYTISSVTHLDNIRQLRKYDGVVADYVIKENFKLVNDINCYGLSGGWTPISGLFTGTFDGNYYTIQNLSISYKTGINSLGLFEHVYTSGAVKDLNFSKLYIYAYTNLNIQAGAVAAYNYGTISNCFVDDSSKINITASTSNVGGIVGLNAGGQITRCYNEGNIYATNSCNVGGIAGSNGLNGTISYSQNYGDIDMKFAYTGNAGGIVGLNSNEASVTRCTNLGTISFSGTVSTTGTVAPCMGLIIGRLTGGSQTKNSFDGNIDKGNLTAAQSIYCGGEVGREG